MYYNEKRQQSYDSVRDHARRAAKRKQQVMDMNCDEEKALDQKVSMRLGLILQREDKGRKDHSDEKAAKIRNLSDRQVQKMMNIYFAR